VRQFISIITKELKMRKGKINRAVLLGQTLLVVAALLIVGCRGNTDGGDAAVTADTPSGQYSSDGAAGASLTIRVSGSVTVGGRTGFSVTALDPTGAPLAYIRIFCESEQGIAILEPSSGGVAFEHTGPTGFMSGVLGGLLPGSYILECRGPQGFNLVDRVSINVTGSAPSGFTGFPGAAGGNLGGGVITD
jgi:hypothetical protein